MCKHGTHKQVTIINAKQNEKIVPVDACIADEIQELNNRGIVTLGSCCGHGKAGEIIEWENVFGKWKGHQDPPHVLIAEISVFAARKLGYRPFPYYYADGKSHHVWLMYLKTGCMTKEDIKLWEAENL